MRVGFTSETEQQQEPEVGTADVNETEDDDDIWLEFFFPKILDFFMIYGVLSLTKDVIEYIKPTKGGD